MIKKWMSLALTCLLLAAGLPARAEDPGTEAGMGYHFDFTVRLNTEALSPALREHAQGYADLLESLRFEGSYAWSLSHQIFDLHFTIQPTSQRARPISFYLHGAEDLMYLNSSLLGEKVIVLNNQSMLEFCTKMYNHMGLPLQHLAYLVPYTYKFNLALPAADWITMKDHADASGVIPTDMVRHVESGWTHRLKTDPPTQVFFSSVGLGSGHEEDFQAVVSELPGYFWEEVAQEQPIQILRDEDRRQEIWRAACGDFLELIQGEEYQEIELTLPPMKTGYKPAVFGVRFVDGSWQSARLFAQLLSTEEDEEDLFDLQASYTSLPMSWPANCQSLINLSLKGGLVPNFGASVYLTGEEDGHFTARIRKPSPEDDPGKTMLTVDGFLQPLEGDVQVRSFTLEDGKGGLELFNSNDASFGPFIAEAIEPALKGALEFLVGIPASACQTMIDDLQEAGVLAVLMGE